MKLYGANLSPFAARVRAAVYHKGLEDQISFSYPPGPLESEAWKTINPLGKIPALAVDSQILIESESILEYLEDRFPTPSLRPDNLEDRARARTLNRLCDLYVFVPFQPIFKELLKKERDQAIIEPNLAKVLDGLAYIEHFLPEGSESSGPYVFGDKPSLTDCGLPATLYFVDTLLPGLGVTDALTRHPRIKRYWDGIKTDPVTRKVLDEIASGFHSLRTTGQPS